MDWGWAIIFVAPIWAAVYAGSFVKHRVIGGDIHWNNSLNDDQILKEQEARGDYCQCRACVRKRGF